MTAQAQRGKKSLTKTLGNYSFILIFAVILIAYLIINGGATTLSGVMNILRHSAVVGIMAFGMGLVLSLIHILTLCTAQWADVPFDELCVLAKKMGYDGLEVACWGEGIDIDKALTDDSYVAWIKDNLAKNGLVMKAMACHIIGQCVGDLPDPRLDNFAPPALAGQPEAIQKLSLIHI